MKTEQEVWSAHFFLVETCPGDLWLQVSQNENTYTPRANINYLFFMCYDQNLQILLSALDGVLWIICRVILAVQLDLSSHE